MSNCENILEKVHAFVASIEKNISFNYTYTLYTQRYFFMAVKTNLFFFYDFLKEAVIQKSYHIIFDIVHAKGKKVLTFQYIPILEK